MSTQKNSPFDQNRIEKDTNVRPEGHIEYCDKIMEYSQKYGAFPLDHGAISRRKWLHFKLENREFVRIRIGIYMEVFPDKIQGCQNFRENTVKPVHRKQYYGVKWAEIIVCIISIYFTALGQGFPGQ